MEWSHESTNVDSSQSSVPSHFEEIGLDPSDHVALNRFFHAPLSETSTLDRASMKRLVDNSDCVYFTRTQLKCTICMVTEDDHFKMGLHLLSKEHQCHLSSQFVEVAHSETESNKARTLFLRCALCNVVTDEVNMEQHLKGKKHAKTLERRTQEVVGPHSLVSLDALERKRKKRLKNERRRARRKEKQTLKYERRRARRRERRKESNTENTPSSQPNDSRHDQDAGGSSVLDVVGQTVEENVPSEEPSSSRDDELEQDTVNISEKKSKEKKPRRRKRKKSKNRTTWFLKTRNSSASQSDDSFHRSVSTDTVDEETQNSGNYVVQKKSPSSKGDRDIIDKSDTDNNATTKRGHKRSFSDLLYGQFKNKTIPISQPAEKKQKVAVIDLT